MKQILFLSALVGLFSVQAASAAPLTYEKGSIFLAFRQADNGEEYLVKVGTAADYANVTGTITVGGLGNIGTDLGLVFGTDWHSQAAVSWSASGTIGLSALDANNPARTIFATKAEVTYGTVETAWTRASATAQSNPDSKMRTMGNTYAGSPQHVSTANSNVGYRQSTGASGSYTSYQAITNGQVTSSYSYFPGGIEGNFGAGASQTGLDLFRMKPTTAGDEGLGEYLGTFKITSAGVLTFTKNVTNVFNAKITGFTRVGTVATLTGLGTASALYKIERSTNLTAWSLVSSPTVAADGAGVIQFIDNASPAGKAFYRIAAP